MKNIVISGFRIPNVNKGTEALSYGSISFLIEQGILKKGMEITTIQLVNNILNKKNRQTDIQEVNVHGIVWTVRNIKVSRIEYRLALSCGILLPFCNLGRTLKNAEWIAAINGGDGFSDIYSTSTFLRRNVMTELAIKLGKKYLLLPQTIGPFAESKNFEVAKRIIQNADRVFVRDEMFVPELKKMNVSYEVTKDLSAFMQPEPWDINIKPGSIGLNVSGLCYSNKFRTLSGQFEQYPSLINCIIEYFLNKGKTIYLIPHSYNFKKPDLNNDDIEATRMVYEKYQNNPNVIFVDSNLLSPQIKYVISRMSFFVGTRMHANFAAIYTGVPVFGLAYSYKFAGAFDMNGQNGERQTYSINNLPSSKIPMVIDKIEAYYRSIYHK